MVSEVSGYRGGRSTQFGSGVEAEDEHNDHNWKVAYADFVTALMAFFLLMWLLGSTTDVERKVIAQQFAPSLVKTTSDGAGEGILKGADLVAGTDSSLPEKGAPLSSQAHMQKSYLSNMHAHEERKQLEAIKEKFTAYSGESELDDGIKRHVISKLTDEYYRIEFHDTPEEPLFVNARPTARLNEIIASVIEVAKGIPNELVIEAYVRSQAVVVKDRNELKLSLERAKLVKTEMEKGSIDTGRIVSITGHADNNSMTPYDPMDTMNNRIAFVFHKN